MKKTKLEEYKKSWRNRREKERISIERRREKARELARKCGDYLRDKYNVNTVYLVGSTVFPERFHPRSDIDLLVKGLPDEKYFEALKSCWDLLPPGFDLDLIPWNDAPVSLKKTARKEGESV